MRKFLFVLALLCGLVFSSAALAEKNYDAFVVQESITITDIGSTYSEVFTGNYAHGLFITNCTVRAGSQVLAFYIEVYDLGSEAWVEYDILTAVNATGYSYNYIGETGWGGNQTPNVLTVFFPKRWRLKFLATTNDDITFSVSLIPLTP